MNSRLDGPPKWAHDETLSLAYEEAKGVQTLLSSWSDALDAKVVAVFGVASIIMGLAPVLRRPDAPGWTLIVLLLALACWLAAVFNCRRAYSPKDFRVGPDPASIQESDWRDLTPAEYRRFRLRDMADSCDFNQERVLEKANALGWAILFTAVEVPLLVLGLYVVR